MARPDRHAPPAPKPAPAPEPERPCEACDGRGTTAFADSAVPCAACGGSGVGGGAS